MTQDPATARDCATGQGSASAGGGLPYGPKAETSRRSQSLDGLRGLAASAVLYAHLVVYMGLLPFAPLGAMGVVIFFALSGYLIGVICWRSEPSIATYRIFLRRRLVRLAPVMIALLVIGGPLLVAFGHLPLREVLRDGLYALSQTTAFATAFGVKTHPSLAPTWSLTVEWVYYFVFPLVLVLLRRHLTRDTSVLRALCGITIGLFLCGLFLPPLQYYLLPVANLSVLFAGGTLATRHHLATTGRRAADEAWTATAILLLSILVFLPGHTLGWGWKAVVLPATTLATLVVLHGCWANSRVAALLAVRPLRHIGLRAYSVYLWHMPVMWLTWVNLPGSPPLLRAAVCLVLVAFVAGLSFRWLERPVLGMRVKSNEPRPAIVMAQERRQEPAAVGLLPEPGTRSSHEGP